MTVTAIQIGLHPDAVDYQSADFSQFKGLTKEGLTKANSDNVAGLRAAGYEVDNCLIATGEAGAEKARTWLSTKRSGPGRSPSCGLFADIAATLARTVLLRFRV